MRTSPIFVAITFLTITAIPASAWHGATEPVLDSVPLDDFHWVAWRVTLAEPGPIVVEVEATTASVEIIALGASLMGPDGSDPDTTYWAMQAATAQTFVQTSGEPPLIDQISGSVDGAFKVAITWGSVPAGEHIVLGMLPGVGDVISGELTLRAGGGATLLAKTEGSSAFGALLRDFSGEANVRWSTPSTTATAIVDAEHERTIDDRFFGWYWRHPSTSVNPAHTMTCTIEYDGPDGGGTGERWYFFDDAPAGTYTFRVPHCVDAGAGPFRTQLFVLGADVTLPS